MKIKTKFFVAFFAVLLGSGLVAGQLLAQELKGEANITYPVKELNNCASKDACRNYCDAPENLSACVSFGEKTGLLSDEEARVAKKFIAAGGKGPGGCRGKEECEKYCDNITNIDECLAFGEKNNLMTPAELNEAKAVQAAIKRGVKPPACGSKKSCDTYCEAPEHMEECIAFGAEAGFIQGKELEDARKMLAAIKRGVQPPACRGKDECEAYCSDPENMEMCMNFAVSAGMMSEQETAEMQKMLAAVKKGVKPPKCRGREECDAYCSSEENFEECANFAEAAGFMSAEEAVMARKTKGKTPGNCRGKEECEAFCNNPDNQETCFNFAKENGLISDEDLEKMEQGKNQMRESLNQMPPEVLACVTNILGAETAEKIKSGELAPSQKLGEAMSQCFQQMNPQQGENFNGDRRQEGNMMAPPGEQLRSAGPGGCANPEECQTYCQSNPDACQNFARPQNYEGQNSEQNFTPPNPQPYNNEARTDFPQPPPGADCNSPEECRQMMPEGATPPPPQEMPPIEIPPSAPTEPQTIAPPPELQPAPEPQQPTEASAPEPQPQPTDTAPQPTAE